MHRSHGDSGPGSNQPQYSLPLPTFESDCQRRLNVGSPAHLGNPCLGSGICRGESPSVFAVHDGSSSPTSGSLEAGVDLHGSRCPENHKIHLGAKWKVISCPGCGEPMDRLHGRDRCTLADLRRHDTPGQLRVEARRFFCPVATCGDGSSPSDSLGRRTAMLFARGGPIASSTT